MSATPVPSAERALWLTLPGAPGSVPLGWLAWLLGCLLAAPFTAALVGSAGAAIAVVAAGWALARRAPSPLDWMRTHHLDDLEVTSIGPGRSVRRLAWEDVETVTQERTALRLEGGGARLVLPLGPVLRSGAWGAVLTRVVPGLAAAMWARLEDGEEVRLAARVDPPARALAWWAYAPALLVCASGTGSALVVLGLAAAERLVAVARAHTSAVALHRTGVALRTGFRSLFVSWRRAGVMRAPYGLLVGVTEGDSGLVAARLPNFWAAAPVIETRAQLGPSTDATVHFRVRVAEGRLAVVGEVEPMA